MKQETINSLYAAVADLAEAFSDKAFKVAEEMEASGDPEQFRKAQEIKANANLLEAVNKNAKSKYPHLFKAKTKWVQS